MTAEGAYTRWVASHQEDSKRRILAANQLSIRLADPRLTQYGSLAWVLTGGVTRFLRWLVYSSSLGR
jgi:hypothetical protein